jgi:hypothetical protein
MLDTSIDVGKIVFPHGIEGHDLCLVVIVGVFGTLLANAALIVVIGGLMMNYMKKSIERHTKSCKTKKSEEEKTQ